MKNLIKLVTLICLSVGMSAISVAQDAANYLRASQEFEYLVAQAAQNGSMPRLSGTRAAELITTLSDSQRFLDSTTYRLKDMSSLMEVCGKANAAVMSYTLFGLKDNVDPKENPAQVALQVQSAAERNILTFQDELEQLQPFLIRCMAKHTLLLNEFVESLKPQEFTDIRRAGLQQARNGISGAYYGFLQGANNLALNESYRARTLQALAETAITYSSILQPAARRKIFDLAKSVQPDAPVPFHHYLQAISDAMSEPRCSGLCGL